MGGLLVAAAVAVGVPWPLVALIVLAIHHPFGAALAVAGWITWAVRRAGSEDASSVRLLHAVAAELRAGSSLRAALDAAADRMPGPLLDPVRRRLAAGRPMSEVAGELAAAVPHWGAAAASAVLISDRTGGKVADVFEGLALLVADAEELEGERRVAGAQARLSAVVIGAVPVVVLAVVAATGRLDLLAASGGPGRLLMATGLVLLGMGGLAMVLVGRRLGGHR